MRPFGNLFKKSETALLPDADTKTEWDALGEEISFDQQNTLRQQNKVIAALTEGDISIIGTPSAEVSHGTRQDFLDEIASGNIGDEQWNYIISHIGGSENKRQEYRDAIKKLEVEALAPRVSGDICNVDGKELTLTPDLLEKIGLAPNAQIFLDNKQVSFSKMYNIYNHLACTAYVSSEEGTKICTYYRSNSSGSWRYLPEYTDEGHWFGKGYNEESLTLPFEMQSALTQLSEEPPLNLDQRLSELAFFGTAKRYNTKEDWIKAHSEKKLRGVHYKETSTVPSYALSPKVSAGPRPAPETVGVELLNSPFGPNYQAEMASYNMRTNLYGDVTVKSFPSENGRLRYTMCETMHNGKHQAWISSVESTNEISAVGTPKQWVEGGVLATPLYEYSKMAGGYGNQQDKIGSYENMWDGYLSKIPLIQKYIQTTEQK